MFTANPAIRFHMLMIWSGVGLAITFFAALVMIGYFPPPSPMLSGEEIMAHVRDNHVMARMGIPVGFLAAGFAILWNTIIATHLWRIETNNGATPVMAIMAIISGAAMIFLYHWTFLFWAGMFYRLDAHPEAIQILHDITWLEVVMPFGPQVAQMLAVGLGGLTDKSENPVFPRWCCFLNFWTALLTMTGVIAIFVFSGPFAWNGIIAFWIPAFAFGAWINAMFFCMRRYVKNNS